MRLEELRFVKVVYWLMHRGNEISKARKMWVFGEGTQNVSSRGKDVRKAKKIPEVRSWRKYPKGCFSICTKDLTSSVACGSERVGVRGLLTFLPFCVPQQAACTELYFKPCISSQGAVPFAVVSVVKTSPFTGTSYCK